MPPRTCAGAAAARRTRPRGGRAMARAPQAPRPCWRGRLWSGCRPADRSQGREIACGRARSGMSASTLGSQTMPLGSVGAEQNLRRLPMRDQPAVHALSPSRKPSTMPPCESCRRSGRQAPLRQRASSYVQRPARRRDRARARPRRSARGNSDSERHRRVAQVGSGCSRRTARRRRRPTGRPSRAAASSRTRGKSESAMGRRTARRRPFGKARDDVERLLRR